MSILQIKLNNNLNYENKLKQEAKSSADLQGQNCLFTTCAVALHIWNYTCKPVLTYQPTQWKHKISKLIKIKSKLTSTDYF